jgi:WD40 repeat protein
MDWTTPLKFQQADFIKRLTSNPAGLLCCHTPGCHSEVIQLSGETLKQVRAFCRQFALTVEQSASVRDILQQCFIQQIGEAAIVGYLGSSVRQLDVEQRQETNQAVALTLANEMFAGIQVKTATTSLNQVRWQISIEEVKQNVVIVFVGSLQAISESCETCDLVLAGFLPTRLIDTRLTEISISIQDLLYIGGLQSYLDSLQSMSASWQWLRTLTGNSSFVYPLAISADGQTLASSSYDGSIKLWEIDNPDLTKALAGQPWSFYPIASGGGGQPLASGSTEKKLIQSQQGKGKLERSLAGHTSGVSAIAICPQGTLLISGGYDGSIKIWQLSNGELCKQINAHSGMVRPLAISSDGKILATGSIDKSVKVWNLPEGKLLKTLPGQTDPVISLAISPDDQTLVSGSQDGTIKIWHLATGELKTTLTGHSGMVRALSIDAGGQTLATGSTEKTIKLWDLQTGTLKRTLTGHSDPIINVAPHPNGKSLELSLFQHEHPGWEDG